MAVMYLVALCTCYIACRPANAQVLGAVRNSIGSTGGFFNLPGKAGAGIESEEAEVPPASSAADTGSRGTISTAKVVSQEATLPAQPPVEQAVPYLSGVTGGLQGAAALGSYAGILDINSKLPPINPSLLPSIPAGPLTPAPQTASPTQAKSPSKSVASEQSPSDPPGTAGMKQGTPVSTPADIRDAEAAASGNGAGRIGHGHGSIAAVTTLCVALVIAAVVS